MNNELFNGCYVILNDGRVRGPVVERLDNVRRAMGVRYFKVEHCIDADLVPGWNHVGTFAGRPRYEHLDVASVISQAFAERAFKNALNKPAHPIDPKPLPEFIDRNVPLFLTQAEHDYLFDWIDSAMQRRDDLDQPAEAEPAPTAVIQRSFTEIKAAFEEWMGRPTRSDTHNTALQAAFQAGYNAALRNESGLGIRPSENAEGGLSDATLNFKARFVGEDLNRLNPLIRKFFEAFAEANDMTFNGIEFRSGGNAVAELMGGAGIVEFQLALNGWPGMRWPDLADVIEPAAPSDEELARTIYEAWSEGRNSVQFVHVDKDVLSRLKKSAAAVKAKLLGVPSSSPAAGAAKPTENPMDKIA